MRITWLLVVLLGCGSTPRKADPPEPQPKPATPPGGGSGGGQPSTEVKHELRRAFSLEVLGLEGTGAKGARVAGRITDLLRAAAREYGAITMGAANKELIDEKLMVSCETEEEGCMSQIGKSLKVDQILYGRVEERGPAFHVALKLLDVETKIVLEWTGTVQDSEPNMQAAARDAISTLVDRFR